MAYLAEPKNPRTKRHHLWNKEELKSLLKTSDLTLTEICKSFAPSANQWRALYSDVRRWKSDDPELQCLLEEHRLRTDSRKRKKMSGGRPRKDEEPEHHDWQLRFIDELLRTKSRAKASLVTPYSPDEIYKMLHEKYSEYDKDFAEMVHLAEMRLVAWAEETMWVSLEEAKSAKDKAWIAKEILKVRDRQRWGDRLDVQVTGTVNHRLPEERLKLLEDLSKSQSQFFEKVEVLALPEGVEQSVPMDYLAVEKEARKAKESEEIVEAEIVDA